jgi:ABC-type branched-subunit amino acid transport system ATPase component
MPLLEVREVSRSFGGLRALERLSFTIETGSITSLIGPNGAGKTTLFNLVSGILPPTEGAVAFRGMPITGWPAYRVAAAGIGRTFQNVHLFATLNCLENVMAACFCRTRSSFLDTLLFLPRERAERKRTREAAEALLARVGLSGRRFAMPRELPYGDQRRLEIARALAIEPEMLMLDEPSAGMIRQEAMELMELIRELRRMGKTIFLIEHNMSLVMSMSDKVVVLNFGQKIAEGPPEAVQRNDLVIEAYLGVQA